MPSMISGRGLPDAFRLDIKVSRATCIDQDLAMQEDDDMLPQVKQQKVTENTLLKKLTEYVERVDTDMVSSCL